MHAVIATSALPLFLGALLSDWAYSRSFQPQWINFSSWLIAGALVLVGLAMLWALVLLLRGREGLVHWLLLLATFVVGFINALVHARDAAATMPTGLALSAVVLVLAAVAGGMGLAGWRRSNA
ncbi:MAG: hypothetical protein GTN84_13895 [Hydrogenophaga sp.]|uniref:hypothetical protein n=1 Tax=Hydrogenophaga sp. TaxID=1904254 RepID=UPI0016B1E6B5|nr:hypothetical protein [Hydrogenophaga sp.]NIM40127.1 hypothetical protein [Hydrogenophaga sp.]NIN25361.1 hypothetical protein [Hydrogenophaga sp.]NIN32218.1 hypothetical protein [Hydrogenophaga sp.]NIN56467.1 hypothetical protein [Hydrogenophaga sp.]NIO52776.1 hypothetical protein [Hydrogenophaga sp.]